jgi:GTPase
MRKNQLIDIAEIFVKAGNGGDGKVSFKREKYLPKGGPDGGNGGAGGSVIFEADEKLATLRDFRSKPNYKGEHGQPGGAKEMTGPDGEDLVIKVPVGTLIYQIENKEADSPSELLIGDLVSDGQQLLVASGGVGGKGNTLFKSSINQTPMQYTEGTKGEEKDLRLEIKLIADIGLVGLPNAGKSTLINYLTSAQAKVASYPFTTLSPNLGVCKLRDGKTAVIADVPGLIEGASEGKGLGDDFLRHVERTRLLVHIVDPSFVGEEDVVSKVLESYEVIRNELKGYSKDLADKQEIIAINKIDLMEVGENIEAIVKAFVDKGLRVFPISAVSGEGLDALLGEITVMLEKTPKTPGFEVTKPIKVYTLNDLPNRRIVHGGVLKKEELKELR